MVSAESTIGNASHFFSLSLEARVASRYHWVWLKSTSPSKQIKKSNNDDLQSKDYGVNGYYFQIFPQISSPLANMLIKMKINDQIHCSKKEVAL